MAKNKSKQEKTFFKSNNRLKIETKHGIWAILFFVLALFFFMSAFGIAGKAGKLVYEIFHYLLGLGYVLLPTLFVLLGSSFIKSKTPNIGWVSMIASVMFLLSGLGIIDIISGEHSGGFLGKILSTPFVRFFDVYASIIFLCAILIISIIVMFDTGPIFIPFFKKIWIWIRRKRKEEGEEEISAPLLDEEGVGDGDSEIKLPPRSDQSRSTPPQKGGDENEEEFEPKKLKTKNYNLKTGYVPPPLSLLEEDKGKPNTGDIKANANIIKRTLANFGIKVEMDEITVGPTVTRYALKPA